MSKKSKKQDRSVPPKSEEQSEVRCSGLANAGVVTVADIAYDQVPKEGEAKPKRQRAWKEAKKEAKRRRTDAKETGKPPRKEAERQIKGKKESSGEKASIGMDQKETTVKGGSKAGSKRREGKKAKASEA